MTNSNVILLGAGLWFLWRQNQLQKLAPQAQQGAPQQPSMDSSFGLPTHTGTPNTGSTASNGSPQAQSGGPTQGGQGPEPTNPTPNFSPPDQWPDTTLDHVESLTGVMRY